EAFMVRFHPQWLRARELVRQGRVGTLRAVQVFFSFFNTDPGNIRNQAAIGGGGLYDLGCYPIVGSRFLFECEPRRAVALVGRHRDAPSVRPVHAPRRGLLPRRPRGDRAALRRGGRGGQHAGDRRALPLGEERPLGRGLRTATAGWSPEPLREPTEAASTVG